MYNIYCVWWNAFDSENGHYVIYLDIGNINSWAMKIIKKRTSYNNILLSKQKCKS